MFCGKWRNPGILRVGKLPLSQVMILYQIVVGPLEIEIIY
jgi:hypothetical protein